MNSHTEIVLIADPKVLAVPILENQEPMVDLADQKEICYGPPPLDPKNTNYTKLRKTIYDKLKQAQTMLPDGLKFCIYECYRSLELQEKIFQERYDNLKKEHPQLTHQELFIESTKFISPVTNLDGSTNIPPHSTGAAIDVYLVDKDGKLVDMGITLDDCYKDLSGAFCKTDSQVISQKAKEYRKIMGNALRAVGFINYPTEYWHWSYGDRYWAYQTKRQFAIYGSVLKKVLRLQKTKDAIIAKKTDTIIVHRENHQQPKLNYMQSNFSIFNLLKLNLKQYGIKVVTDQNSDGAVVFHNSKS